MKRMYINPKFKQRLEAAGGVDFNTILELSSLGQLVDEDKGRTTHKLNLGDDTYFLKRVHKPIIAPSVEAVLSLRKPHHFCWRELLQTNVLQASGFPVLEIAAAGERATRGVLDYSFLLTLEVKGESLEQVFSNADTETKITLLAQLGELVGRLHSCGYFAPVRMKDVMVTRNGEFVMIDRETRWPGARRYSKRKAILGLSRTVKRQSRLGLNWEKEQIDAHLTAYLSKGPLPYSVDELRQLL